MRQSESRVAALLVPPLRRLALLDDASPCLLLLLPSALDIVTDTVILSPRCPALPRALLPPVFASRAA